MEEIHINDLSKHINRMIILQDESGKKAKVSLMKQGENLLMRLCTKNGIYVDWHFTLDELKKINDKIKIFSE